MTISIAMTTYNGEKYIKTQLLSLLNQTLPADEIIICDDGSTDTTIDLLEDIIQKNVGRTKITVLVNEDNLGYIKNFYKAISLTHGDYIFLADQDDEWHLDKIEKMIHIMQKERCVAICTNFSLIDKNNNLIADKSQFSINPFLKKVKKKLTPVRFRDLVFGNVAQGCTYCFTKEVREIYLQVKNDQLVHDYQIMFIATLEGKVMFYDEELVNYRLHNSNAIGFIKKANKTGIELKKPSRKPFMVQFIDDVDAVQHVHMKYYYAMLYYLRIPYFVSRIRR